MDHSYRVQLAGWRTQYLPDLVIIGVGIAISNSRAVVEAFMGRKSGFVRTPKKGDHEIIHYKEIKTSKC